MPHLFKCCEGDGEIKQSKRTLEEFYFEKCERFYVEKYEHVNIHATDHPIQSLLGL